MRKKKFLAAALVCTMAVPTLLTGCGNNPGGGSNGDFKLTNLKVMVDGTVNSVKQETEAQMTVRAAFIPQLEAAIGEAIGHDIKIEFEVGDHSKYNDYVGRKFMSEEYPDVMIMSANMMKQYATTGLLWDMSKAYDNAKFQERITLPSINESMKDKDGHLYGFAPCYGNGAVTFIKQSWLDNVGIKGDDIKTYDDFYNMLLKFTREDPDGNGVKGDTYGYVSAGLIGTEAPWIMYVPEFWQDAYPSIVQDENGVWIDGFQTEATKKALERLKQAYKDGVIQPDSFTYGTKQARELWWSADQKGSAGAYCYWAGSWYQTSVENLEKNKLPSEVYELPPIAEIKNSIGGYINREAPVWVILDDGDGNDAREQAIFDAFLDTMLDGDKIQTLWTYGAEDVEWSTKAGTVVQSPDDPEKRKEKTYEEGQFHNLVSLADNTKLSGKNHLDPAFVISPLTNGYVAVNELAAVSNKFFTENCVNAPASPSSEKYAANSAAIVDARNVAISSVVIKGGDVDAAMEAYKKAVGKAVEEILAELNAQ